MGKNSSLVIASVFAVLFSPVASATEEIVVTTLEWAPYTGSSLPKLGATTEVVRQAFEKIGLDAKVEIVPWKRAISMAKDGNEAIAYFPGYHCKHMDGFTASEPIGNGPLGLAEHVDAPIAWTSIDDIGEQKLKIGTVIGYSNTEEFDEKAGTGWVRAIAAKDDITNLKKLLRKRIDAAVIDKLVLSYLLATDPALKDVKGQIQFDERPLEEKTLYLCFWDNEEGRALRDRFNEGLKDIAVDDIVDRYFAEVF